MHTQDRQKDIFQNVGYFPEDLFIVAVIKNAGLGGLKPDPARHLYWQTGSLNTLHF